MPTIQQIVKAHRNAYLDLRARTGTVVGGMWDAYGGPSDTNLDQFRQAVIPVAQASKLRAVALMSGYIGLTRAVALGGPPSPPDLDPEGLAAAIRGGLDPIEEYARPTLMARWLLSEGADYLDALNQARDRAKDLAETDVMLVNRDTMAAASSSDDRVVGYRRVISGGGCDLCEIASEQEYHTGDLSPIHNNCNCDVVEVYASEDPGKSMNDDARSQRADDGTAPDVAVREHGELGPMLTNAADKFTAESDLN